MIPFLFYSRERIIKRALTCRGWTNYNRLSLLYDLVKETSGIKGDILEIGSAFGRSTVLFGLSSNKKVWSIDPHTGGRYFIERNENQDSFEEFKSNLNLFKIKNIEILKYTTEEVIKNELIPTQVRFSLVFIDGLHTKKGVTIDFQLAYQKINIGGIIIFDDYFKNGIEDYKEAIDTLVAENNITLNKDPGNNMVFFKKHEQYFQNDN